MTMNPVAAQARLRLDRLADHMTEHQRFEVCEHVFRPGGQDSLSLCMTCLDRVRCPQCGSAHADDDAAEADLGWCPGCHDARATHPLGGSLVFDEAFEFFRWHPEMPDKSYTARVAAGSGIVLAGVVTLCRSCWYGTRGRATPVTVHWPANAKREGVWMERK